MYLAIVTLGPLLLQVTREKTTGNVPGHGPLFEVHHTYKACVLPNA